MRKAKIEASDTLARRSSGVMAVDAGPADDGETGDSDTQEGDTQHGGNP